MRIGQVALAALVAFATPAVAERTGFYVGGDIGQSSWDLSQRDANNLSNAITDTITFYNPSASVTSTGNDFSDTSTTYGFFVGYQFLRYFAIEAAWMDLGDASVDTDATYVYNVVNPIFPSPPNGGTFNTNAQFESTGWALSGLPMLPIGDAWNLYARLGVYWGDNELSGRFRGQDTRNGVAVGSPYDQKFSESDTSTVFLWGLGASHTWNQRVSMRLEYTNIADVADVSGYSADASDVERFTVGLVYRFGDTEEAVPVAAAVPVAVAAAEPAKCSDSDGDGVCDADDKCPNTPAGDRVGPFGCSCDVVIRTNFAFDSAELTAEDKATLDGVAARLTELQFVEGTATGHTDNVGTAEYNQKLSERRAQAVVDYLAAKGVYPGRIKASGMGLTKPIADNATEEGRAQNRRVTIRRTDCGPAE